MSTTDEPAEVPPEPIEFVARDGVVLRGDVWSADGHMVLLLHGGGQNRWSWRATGAALRDAGLTAIALDARGHGDSDWTLDHRYAIDDFALDVLDVVGQLPRAPALVGASLGGISSLLALARAPTRRFAAVVLVDVVVRNNPAGFSRISGFMRSTVNGFASLDEAAEAIADYLPHRPRRGSTDGLLRTLRRASDGRWLWRWDPGMLDLQFGGSLSELEARLAAAAGHLHAPCLIVRGELSDVVSRAAAEELARVLPDAEHAVVDGAGHTVAGDRNDAFTASVLEFLQRRSQWDAPAPSWEPAR